jgi:hypothetical protein
MKKLLLPFIVAVSLFSITSCNNSIEVDVLNLNNISDILTQEEWKVGYFLNNNVEETSDFDSFKLTFNPNGTVLAKKGFTEITGRWIEDKVSKNILFYFDSNGSQFTKLNDNWLIAFKEDKSYQFINQDNTDILKIERP